MDEVLLNKIIKICSQAFEVDQKIISLDTSTHNLPEWDSLSHLKLILMIESSFEIDLDPLEIESIGNVSALLKLVEGYL
jgi:acyl carrier protein